MRHFLDLSQVEANDLRSILDHSSTMKAHGHERLLEGKMLAMVFDKPSTRTRVSFDVGMRQLGGQTIILEGNTSQLGAGETIADTARVLSRYVDAIMIRTTDHTRLLELAEYATVPVINGLTDATHPCQIMADVMTFEEHKGPITGKRIAWSGDGNNVVHSLLEASARFEFRFSCATPRQCQPNGAYVDWANKNGGTAQLTDDPVTAVKDADCVVTDKWVSMGFEEDAQGHNVFKSFQVNEALMAHAKEDAIFMHCLPAKRGEEVSDAVMDGSFSVVFDEAENRLHAQKGILAWCLQEETGGS